MKQLSYVMVKPEFANNEKVIKEVKKRLLLDGLNIDREAYVMYDKERAAMHYNEHINKAFYPELEAYITSDKAYGMVVSGEEAITRIRELVGGTKNPEEGTIRYDIPKMLGIERRITENVVHASDSPESAKKEIEIFDGLRREFSNKSELVRDKF